MGAEKEDAQSMYDYGIILLKVSTQSYNLFLDITITLWIFNAILNNNSVARYSIAVIFIDGGKCSNFLEKLPTFFSIT